MSADEKSDDPPGASDGAGGSPGMQVPRRLGEGVVLAAIALLAAYFLIAGQQIESRSADAVGPVTFPTAIAVLLLGIVVLAVIELVRTGAGQSIEVRRPGALLLSMALLLVFVPLVQSFGYYWVILPWTLAFAWAARVRTPFLIGITLGSVLFIARVVFEIVLRTPLP